MACHALNQLAQRALDTLKRWDEDLTQRCTEAQAVHYDIEHRVSASRERSKRRNDVIGTRVVAHSTTDYTAVVRHIAGTLITEHQHDIDRRRCPERNTDALAAWRLVLKTNNRNELVERVHIAAEATRRVPN